MLGPWFNFLSLAVESQQVVALRLGKLALGGALACDEAVLMCVEKLDEANKASFSLMGGASADSVVTAYRAVVQANAARLLG